MVSFFFCLTSEFHKKTKKLTDLCIYANDVDAGISQAALLFSDNGDSPLQNTQISIAAIDCNCWLNTGFPGWQSDKRWLLDWLLLNRQQHTQNVWFLLKRPIFVPRIPAFRMAIKEQTISGFWWTGPNFYFRWPCQYPPAQQFSNCEGSMQMQMSHYFCFLAVTAAGSLGLIDRNKCISVWPALLQKLALVQ